MKKFLVITLSILLVGRSLFPVVEKELRSSSRTSSCSRSSSSQTGSSRTGSG